MDERSFDERLETIWRELYTLRPGCCPYPVIADHSIKTCVAAGHCGCEYGKEK